MIETFGISDSSIENLFDALDGYELSYAYKGDFTQQLTDSILSLSETNLEVINEPVKNRKKVYFIMVESLQNITRHQDAKVIEGFFSIYKSSTGFLITSGNIIQNSHINSLRDKLEKVNSMSAEELKEYYYSVLNSEGFSEKGGAGLGLIEMVRKSGNKLSYDFDRINDTYSYFNFQINVKTNTEEVNNSLSNLPNNLSLAKEIHKTVDENNVKLFFHGKFEHESLKGLISMTENSLSNSLGSAFKKTIVAVMIEMLQNICYHGVDKTEASKETPGLILICEDDSKYAMITGNYIANDKIERFLKHVDEINGLNEEGLNNLFNQVILKENKIGERGAGLGLIDLRFKTKNKIETNILKRSDTRSFLIIKSHINY
jgi:hypothetical protein